jgi:4-hydroxy-tetrahydrodipicolinate synthase
MSYKYDKLYVALVTPFKPGTEEIDEGAWRSFLRYWVQPRFVDAGGSVIVSPEAGEVFYTTKEEKVRLAEIALEEVGDKMLVVSGVMQPTTKDCVEEAKALKEVGVQGLFLIPPMGAIDITTRWDPIKFPEVWTDQLQTICDAVDLPVITHPAGGKYGGIPVPAMLKILDAVPQIVGWKMITPTMRATAQALREYSASKRHVGILMAGATWFHEALAYDHFDGTVSGFWNYAMEPMMDHLDAWRKNDVVKARQVLFDGLIQLHDYVMGSEEDFRLHSAYKVATWLRGLIPDPFMRAPQRRLRTEHVRKLRDLLKACHLEVIPDKDIKKAYPDV